MLSSILVDSVCCIRVLLTDYNMPTVDRNAAAMSRSTQPSQLSSKNGGQKSLQHDDCFYWNSIAHPCIASWDFMSSDLCLGPPNPLDENETHVSKLLGSSPIKVSGSRAKLNKSRAKAVLALGLLRIEIGLIPSHRYVMNFWTFRGFSWLLCVSSTYVMLLSSEQRKPPQEAHQ